MTARFLSPLTIAVFVPPVTLPVRRGGKPARELHSTVSRVAFFLNVWKEEVRLFADEATIRRTVAKNIAAYRKAHRDTQLDLAEKLNYSDKSVSKWERGESLPDVCILAQIAALYGVTVSNLIGEVVPPKKDKPHYHLFVLLLSIAAVFAVATVVFSAFVIVGVNFRAWLFFIYAIPVAAVVAIVFTHLWWGYLAQGVAVSVFVWSMGLCIYLSLSIDKLALIFVVCASVQVLVVLAELVRLFRSRK